MWFIVGAALGFLTGWILLEQPEWAFKVRMKIKKWWASR